MKRLIVSLFLALGIFVNISPVSAFERWKFQMFEPAATSNRTLNIEYKVLSISVDDEFTIKLYQNNLEVASNTVTTDFGDSGVFTVSLPATGTYEYKTVADNSNDALNKEQTRTVQITNAPQPTVTTVNTANNGTAGANTNGGAGAGTVATDADGDGVVDDEAATTGEDNSEDVLGLGGTVNSNKEVKSDAFWWVVLLLLAVGGIGYYVRKVRSDLND